jgi:hypothetical protein
MERNPTKMVDVVVGLRSCVAAPNLQICTQPTEIYGIITRDGIPKIEDTRGDMVLYAGHLWTKANI